MFTTLKPRRPCPNGYKVRSATWIPGVAGCPKAEPRAAGCPKPPLNCGCTDGGVCANPPEKGPLVGAAKLIGACGCPNAGADWTKPANPPAEVAVVLDGCPKALKGLGVGVDDGGEPKERPLPNGDPPVAVSGADWPRPPNAPKPVGRQHS